MEQTTIKTNERHSTWQRQWRRRRRTMPGCRHLRQMHALSSMNESASQSRGSRIKTRSFTCRHHCIEFDSKFPGSSVHDITPFIKDSIRSAQLVNGTVTVSSQHTTLGITVNENEERLVGMDIRFWLNNTIAKPEHMYFHNDIEVMNSLYERNYIWKMPNVCYINIYPKQK